MLRTARCSQTKRAPRLISRPLSTSDDDDDMGAPDAAVYESHSGGSIDTSNGLLEKGETKLNTTAATGTTNKRVQ